MATTHRDQECRKRLESLDNYKNLPQTHECVGFFKSIYKNIFLRRKGVARAGGAGGCEFAKGALGYAPRAAINVSLPAH